MEDSSLKAFAMSFGVGIFVGVLYTLLKVRAPAPPLVALVGLLGMVIGEQLPDYVRAIGWFTHK